MKKILVLSILAGVSHGMDFHDLIPDPNFKMTYTLQDVPKDVFSLEQVGAQMILDGIISNSIYLFYDEYHGLKMFHPLAVSVFDSKDEIISALWRSFHKKGIAKPPEGLEPEESDDKKSACCFF